MTSSDQLLPYTTPEDAQIEISERQDAVERQQSQTLALDGQIREVHIKREDQRRTLREKAYNQAVAVILGMASYVAFMALVIAFGNGEKFAPEAQIAIFATPIIAIATITVFILRGVYSGFSERSLTEDAQTIGAFTQLGNGN